MLLTLMLSLSVAVAQDTGDTGDTAVEAPEGALAVEVPVGSALTLPEGQDTGEAPQGVEEPMLLTLRKPPSLGDGINLIPAGSLVLLRGEDGAYTSFRVEAKAFLMPEPMYDSALIQAKQLKICQPALNLITEETLRMADRTHKALSTCGSQFDVDADAIEELKQYGTDQEIRAIVAEDGLKRARKGQVVAWAITGGVILGAAAATSISLGTL